MIGPELPIDEIDRRISDVQDTLMSLTSSDPLRPALISCLATVNTRLRRYKRSDDKRDLNTTTLQSTNATLLPYSFSTKHDPNPISTLFLLTEALFQRSFKHRQPTDVKCCIKCLRLLRNLPLEVFGITHRDEVTTLLVCALALKVKLEPSKVMNGLEEMLALCQELLASDLSGPGRNIAFECFAEVVRFFVTSWNQPSEQVIKCLREANARLPNIRNASLVLFMSLSWRFFMTKSKQDYEDAMALFDKGLGSHFLTDSPEPYSEQVSGFVAEMARVRFSFYGNPEYLEEAIDRRRAYLRSLSPDDPERGAIIQTLEKLERTRLDELGVSNDPPEVSPDNSRVVNRPSFSQLTATLESNAIKGHAMTLDDCVRHDTVIQSMNRITDKTGIEEAVKYCRLLLTSLQQCPDYMMMSTLVTISYVGDFLYHAFTLTDNAEYLDKSVDTYRDVLKRSHAQYVDYPVIRRLIKSLSLRYMLLKDRNDFDEVIELYSTAVIHTQVKAPDRFEMSCLWAQTARGHRHSSTSTAYKNAISLMQDSLAFAPTLEMQHFRLVAMRDHFERLPLDYASYQLRMGRLNEAIETLEQGRGLLWSEMRGLRTSIDHLHVVDSRLAEIFAAINRDLEALTTSGPPIVRSNVGNVDNGEGMDTIGQIVVKQRKLLDERANLITQIRSLPGFETFLMSPSFDTLYAVAAHGPVVIINHSQWCSDIIILLDNSPPFYYPTPSGFYERAKCLKEQLMAARKTGLDSMEYEDTLTSVLATLYDLVGRPVIQILNELNVPEQSRIWWCPTSVFCSLPLHAMGPVRSECFQKLYFSDLYIPSYTPTLSALIESRKHGSNSFEKPSVLLVAQPDDHIPGAWAEISFMQRLKTTVTTLVSESATPSAVTKHLQDHRFAHFTCHGSLETGKPFDASFRLHNGERLTLLEIIRSRLPSAEFAFLAACHTAELTEESIADEGLHLSAAVQYSGFRSVVGTMWGMADIDGPFLAKSFYDSLFSDKWRDVPYYQRTAEALRDAVKKLRRRKRMTTERWVNFVHFGA